MNYIEYPNGDKAWWLNGKRHREDGPAMEYADGKKVSKYYKKLTGKKKGFSVMLQHKQVSVNFFGKEIQVDEGLKDLLLLMWKHRIRTCNSC